MSENDAAKKFAYRKGQVARQHGKSANANPYEAGTCYFKCWMDGWQSADRSNDTAPQAL